MFLLFCLSAFAEASILIVTFYWAPWISLAYSGDGFAPSQEPDSTPMLASPPLDRAAEENVNLALNPKTSESMEAMSSASSLPFVFIYSTLMLSTMIGQSALVTHSLTHSLTHCRSVPGNYLYSLSSHHYSNDTIFQVVLGLSSAAFFISSISSSPLIILLACLTVHLCAGCYWPSVGFLRGRYLLAETRGVSIALARYPSSICPSEFNLF
jgi:hypothetical protein